MRTKSIIFFILAAMLSAMPVSAQFGRIVGSLDQLGKKKEQPQTQQTPANQQANQTGKIYYVSVNGKSRGAGGLSVETAKKDIQAVLNIIKENNESGSVIRVSEGNFLGAANAGYIEISSWVTIEGGWNADFTERNPFKYITRIQPTQDQLGTNGAKGLIHISGLDDVMAKKPKGTLVIDGICVNLGYENHYMPADPSDPRFGCPSKAFETGRMVDAIPPQVEHQIFHSDGWIAGNVIIRNCVFANGVYFALQFGSRCGEVEICNNVFISNRYGACRITAGDKNGEASHVSFHHNTVAFSWCRDKEMGDMGYGYECMTQINCDIHHNIFACNNYAAIARTHVLSGPDKVIEAKRVTNIYDNAFFMNAADLQLPPTGGGKWTNVKVAQFEDVDEHVIPKVDGNFELKEGDSFISALDQDYLKAFANLKVVSSSSFDRNSAANQFRNAMGMNMQGSETIRVSMYGNRYNFDKALKLFGAKAGYGAQKL